MSLTFEELQNELDEVLSAIEHRYPFECIRINKLVNDMAVEMKDIRRSLNVAMADLGMASKVIKDISGIKESGNDV